MKLRYLAVVICVSFLNFNGAYADPSSPRPTTTRSISLPETKTTDEQSILEVVRKIYDLPTRDYICTWNGKLKNNNRAKIFSSYFTEEIVETFFRDTDKCQLVAFARYGFTPLEGPSQWTDRQFLLVQIEKPEINADTATVEVRFWQSLNKRKPFRDQDHGGTIVYLKRVKDKWKVSNLEGNDMLGASGFYSLLNDYPSVAKPEWKDMDYRKSLKNPQPK